MTLSNSWDTPPSNPNYRRSSVHICCIVDGIVHFIWMRGWVNNYPHSVCAIYCYQFKMKNIISLYDLLVFQYTLSTSTSFFFQSQNSVYIFPHIFTSRNLCRYPMSYCSWEYHYAGFECRTRHLIFNCFDSCSLGVLMFSYVYAHVYSTSICDLLLFLIAEWSQFLVTIFIEAHLLYLYNFNVLY